MYAHIHIHIHKYNCLSPYNVTCMCMFSGLTICYWIGDRCALPQKRLFLWLSAFHNCLQFFVCVEASGLLPIPGYTTRLNFAFVKQGCYHLDLGCLPKDHMLKSDPWHDTIEKWQILQDMGSYGRSWSPDTALGGDCGTLLSSSGHGVVTNDFSLCYRLSP